MGIGLLIPEILEQSELCNLDLMKFPLHEKYFYF